MKYLLKSNKLQHIVVISNRLKEMILSKVRCKRIVVAHDGADIPLNSFIEETKRKYFFNNDNELKIGYVGHLYPGKGGEIILKLAKKLAEYWVEIKICGLSTYP